MCGLGTLWNGHRYICLIGLQWKDVKKSCIESIWHIVGTVPRNPVIISHLRSHFLVLVSYRFSITYLCCFIKSQTIDQEIKLSGSVFCLSIKTSMWLVHLTVHSWMFKSKGHIHMVLFRNRAYLAFKHLSPWEHVELWHGEGMVCGQPARVQQRCFGLWWREHHCEGNLSLHCLWIDGHRGSSYLLSHQFC